MGVPRDEILSGMERLLRRLGLPGENTSEGDLARFRGPEGIEIEVGPMPEGKAPYPILFPRTLVVLRGEDSAVASFHREVLLSFLRPTG